MTLKTNIELINEEITPLLDKALEIGVVLTVISINLKPEPGQERVSGGINSRLNKDELIGLLEDTLINLKANQ